MIGNDIVDILASRQESNWKRKGFLDKLFTTGEITLIHENDDPELMVWLIWSAKESVYKIVNRDQKKMFFTPKKFEFLPDHFINNGPVSGLVNYENGSYNFSSTIKGACIHTTAISCNTTANYYSKKIDLVDMDLHTQQATVRDELIQFYSKIRGIKEELVVRKNAFGIPYLIQKDQPLNVCFSLSHHGGFGGFAICLD